MKKPVKKTFYCIDAHSGGSPVRLIAGGVPSLTGDTLLEKRAHFLHEYDWIRKGLMLEPKGHEGLSGSVLTAPSDPAADLAMFFTGAGSSPFMSGHALIATVTIAIEEGLVLPKKHGSLKVETPVRLLDINYQTIGNKVKSVKYKGLPAYTEHQSIVIQVDGLGSLEARIIFAGNFIATIDIQSGFSGAEDFSENELVRFTRQILETLRELYTFTHPSLSYLSGCTHVMWEGAYVKPGTTAKGLVCSTGKLLERSASGTGTAANMVRWFEKGLLKADGVFIQEGVAGSAFTGSISGVTRVGDKSAIIPSIEGRANVFGYNNIMIDPEEDPYAGGFRVESF